MAGVEPRDLPSGYAETTQPGILHLKAELGDKLARRLLEQQARDGFPTLMFELPDGKLLDAGIRDYGEFFCSLTTALRLLRDGLKMNGRIGTVMVAQRYTNGAQMRWTPTMC